MRSSVNQTQHSLCLGSKGTWSQRTPGTPFLSCPGDLQECARAGWGQLWTLKGVTQPLPSWQDRKEPQERVSQNYLQACHLTTSAPLGIPTGIFGGYRLGLMWETVDRRQQLGSRKERPPPSRGQCSANHANDTQQPAVPSSNSTWCGLPSLKVLGTDWGSSLQWDQGGNCQHPLDQLRPFVTHETGNAMCAPTCEYAYTHEHTCRHTYLHTLANMLPGRRG